MAGVWIKVTGHERGQCDFYISEKCRGLFCHWLLKMGTRRLGKRERERNIWLFLSRTLGLLPFLLCPQPTNFTLVAHIYASYVNQHASLSCTHSVTGPGGQILTANKNRYHGGFAVGVRALVHVPHGLDHLSIPEGVQVVARLPGRKTVKGVWHRGEV